MPATLCLETWMKLMKSIVDKLSESNLTERQSNVSAELLARYTKCMRLYDNAVALSVTEKVVKTEPILLQNYDIQKWMVPL